MTERPDASEAEIAEVRRLLAEARLREPMPDDVAARLDDVLAGLRDQKPAPRPDLAEVVPISAQRRRRVAGLLVAAAAIVVGGVVVAPHVHLDSSSTSGAASSAGDRAAEAQASAGDTRNQGNTGNQGDTTEEKQASPSTVAPSTAGAPRLRDGRLVVRSQHFSADALRGRALLDDRAFLADQPKTCADVPTGSDAVAGIVAAEYQGAPAALVYRPVAGTSQVVDLYVCGTPRPIRSTTLPDSAGSGE